MLNTKWLGVKKGRGGGGRNGDLFWLKPSYFDLRSCHSISCKGLSVSSAPGLHIPDAPRCASSPAQPGCPWGGVGGFGHPRDE